QNKGNSGTSACKNERLKRMESFKYSRILFWILSGFIISTIESNKCKKKEPKNHHGVQPFIVIGQEEEEFKENLLRAIIPQMSTEWIVQFKFKLTAAHTHIKVKCNLIHLSQSGAGETYGDRTPSVYVYKETMEMRIFTAINGKHKYKGYTVQYGIDYNVEIHQRYKSGGKYTFFIIINGKRIMKTVNTQAEQFYDVKVYASNLWEPACNGTISDFKITNFL
uniref:Uncharacterized protein n=1 Tax=Clytia hemisphaerica TaxID=252671 RepID=A0A7M5VBT2_9CNID